ncbi:MAG: succinate dehydrogenase assembly factor 2 [Gammaproteobacteria bacterium]|nr:succinate dehydrogenase assembly factor 2 [Gammaproteobacteria bacterium]MBT8124033.1 succinate dehydrogenase assembly factor 2 [Gammaproteobacteria bacterium]
MESLQKLAWRCRRGTKELDFLMQKYLNNYYQTANEDLQHAFERMLDMQDPELYDLLVGRQTSKDQNINQVIEYIYR